MCRCMDLYGCYREQPSEVQLFLGDLDITACFCFVGLVGGNDFLHLYYFCWRKALVELLTCQFIQMGRKDEALLPVLFWIKHFKASERSHPVQVKPNAACHCYPLIFIHTISVLLNFCFLIWKCLECLKSKVQQPQALQDCTARAKTRTPLQPRTSLCIQKQWLVDGHRFQFPVCSRLKLSEAKWRWQPKTDGKSVRGSE